jgi:hypothetical protein
VGPEPSSQSGSEFERELRQALERRPAPPSVKGKILERRRRQKTERLRFRTMWLQRLAACIVLAGALGGGFAWHRIAEQRKGEQARAQVFTALRIASHALSEMNAQLADRAQDSK